MKRFRGLQKYCARRKGLEQNEEQKWERLHGEKIKEKNFMFASGCKLGPSVRLQLYSKAIRSVDRKENSKRHPHEVTLSRKAGGDHLRAVVTAWELGLAEKRSVTKVGEEARYQEEGKVRSERPILKRDWVKEARTCRKRRFAAGSKTPS